MLARDSRSGQAAKRRSPVTYSEYRKGKPHPRKGEPAPHEILTPDEVASLFEAANTLYRDETLRMRNRAMLGLMYYAEVKIGTLVKLAVRHYDPDSGTLTIPGARYTADQKRQLDPISRRLLDDWLAARAELHLRATAPLFCVLQENLGRPLRTGNIRVMFVVLRRRTGIQKRVSSEGLRASRVQHRQNETGRFEATIIAYINAEGFRRHYRRAYQKWVDAHQLLETSPERHASPIGHLCREAIIEFSDQLASEYNVEGFTAMQTKAKVRAVFAEHGDVSATLRKAVEALLDYWNALIELANRQEHGRSLTADDSRGVVFQTMLVMREIDRALAQ